MSRHGSTSRRALHAPCAAICAPDPEHRRHAASRRGRDNVAGSSRTHLRVAYSPRTFAGARSPQARAVLYRCRDMRSLDSVAVASLPLSEYTEYTAEPSAAADGADQTHRVESPRARPRRHTATCHAVPRVLAVACCSMFSLCQEFRWHLLPEDPVVSICP